MKNRCFSVLAGNCYKAIVKRIQKGGKSPKFECNILDTCVPISYGSIKGNKQKQRVDILDNGSLKIQYNRNRFYDYYTGRFTTHDPLAYLDGMNLYEYVRSIPSMLMDPLGLLRWAKIRPPHMDGRASVLLMTDSDDCWVRLYVDGREKWTLRVPSTGGKITGQWNYNWLKRHGSGEVRIQPCRGRGYKKTYKVTDRLWQEDGMKATYGLVENLGLHFVALTARGKYKEYGRYSGDRELRWPTATGLWTSNVYIYADWYYNQEAGEGRGYLYNDRSVFGSSGSSSQNEDYYREPVTIGPPGDISIELPRWGTIASLVHPTGGKWFIAGYFSRGTELTVQAMLGIGAAPGNGYGFPRTFSFRLPGRPEGFSSDSSDWISLPDEISVIIPYPITLF